MTEKTEPFGFHIVFYLAEDEDPEGFEISLPHQCDRWQISGDKYGPPVSFHRATADLQLFIAEAQEALSALLATETYEGTKIPEGRGWMNIYPPKEK